MQARRTVWFMLALSIYLGLFPTDGGPTVQAGDADGTSSADDDCVTIGPDGRVTVTPGDCVPPPDPAS
jgi:hypothetical protein